MITLLVEGDNPDHENPGRGDPERSPKIRFLLEKCVDQDVPSNGFDRHRHSLLDFFSRHREVLFVKLQLLSQFSLLVVAMLC